jgi:hypothetical protein
MTMSGPDGAFAIVVSNGNEPCLRHSLMVVRIVLGDCASHDAPTMVPLTTTIPFAAHSSKAGADSGTIASPHWCRSKSTTWVDGTPTRTLRARVERMCGSARARQARPPWGSCARARARLEREHGFETSETRTESSGPSS